MRRRWRIWRSNPNANLRLGQVAVLGASLAGALSGGEHPLLNIVALLFVAATAWFEGRYADAMAEFLPAQVRRGAFIRLGAGVLMLLAGWRLPGLLDLDRDGWVEALAAAGLFGGLALILGASARFLMSDGARYAGRKLQERLDDDV
jgi:hypothetical protein